MGNLYYFSLSVELVENWKCRIQTFYVGLISCDYVVCININNNYSFNFIAIDKMQNAIRDFVNIVTYIGHRDLHRSSLINKDVGVYCSVQSCLLNSYL